MNDVFNNLRSLFLSNSESNSESELIISKLKNLNSTNLPRYNPNYIPSRSELLHTETLNSLIQNGGNVIKGLRNENKLNDFESSSITSFSSEMYGGKRSKPSAGDALHQEALDYLKNDLNLSPLESRAYKSLAYRFIKDKHPDSTSVERSKLMLSLVKSENFLDEFKDKLDETMKIIENIDSEKMKRDATESKEEKPKKVKKTKEVV
jgi:hypothetical protein